MSVDYTILFKFQNKPILSSVKFILNVIPNHTHVTNLCYILNTIRATTILCIKSYKIIVYVGMLMVALDCIHRTNGITVKIT